MSEKNNPQIPVLTDIVSNAKKSHHDSKAQQRKAERKESTIADSTNTQLTITDNDILSDDDITLSTSTEISQFKALLEMRIKRQIKTYATQLEKTLTSEINDLIDKQFNKKY